MECYCCVAKKELISSRVVNPDPVEKKQINNQNFTYFLLWLYRKVIAVGSFFFLIDTGIYLQYSNMFKQIGSDPELFHGSRINPSGFPTLFSSICCQKSGCFVTCSPGSSPSSRPSPFAPPSHTRLYRGQFLVSCYVFFSGRTCFLFLFCVIPRAQDRYAGSGISICVLADFFFLEVGKSCFLCTKLFDLFRKLNDK